MTVAAEGGGTPHGSAVLSGRLVVVATPIGNLDDLSPRALAALRSSDVIACEDTRRTRALLSHAGIHDKTLVALHDHNESSALRPLLARLERGDVVAVVSDAGMPTLSDPGTRLVSAASAAGADVTAVPGPSALTTALALSGLVAGRFFFEGFLPRKGVSRKQRLEEIAAMRCPCVLFEAPHRLEATLSDLLSHCGPRRRTVLAREMTKLHEEVWRGTLEGAVEHSQSVPPRGEYTIVLDAAGAPAPPADEEVAAALAPMIASGTATKQAAEQVAKEMGVPRRRAYALAVGLRQ